MQYKQHLSNFTALRQKYSVTTTTTTTTTNHNKQQHHPTLINFKLLLCTVIRSPGTDSSSAGTNQSLTSKSHWPETISPVEGKVVEIPGGTLPETNSLHLKMTPWKRRFLLEIIIFRCYIRFREGIHKYAGC